MKYLREWKTTIQESVTGKEKRSALYTWPRKGLEYELVFKEANEKIPILGKRTIALLKAIGILEKEV